MKILSLLIFYVSLYSPEVKTDSPHGAGFKIHCSTCHSSKDWQLDKTIYSFDHNTTKMPLLGQHNVVGCRQCHPSLVFSEAKTECISCHNDIHQSTVGSDCSRCHTPASWLVKNINEIHRMSRFPLVGAHRTAECLQCHKSENLTRFDVPGINCVDCHRQNYQASTNPNHTEAGFSEECMTCHSENSFQWIEAKYNHSIFPLTQAHSKPRCIDCHTSGKYAQTPSDCFACHEKDYLASKDPDHSTMGYSKSCTDCHTLSPGWKPANFDHTRFPLTLGHSGPKCSDCHINGNFSTVTGECFSCHQQNYLSTKEPDHTAAGFSKTCTECHTANPGWKPTNFVHNLFPLTKGHSTPKCSDCHTSGDFKNTVTDCYACHSQDYLSAKEPDHNTSGFSKTCTECHTTNPGWKPTTFNHNLFPLTLGHSTPKCSDCHKSGSYASTSPDCYSCHQPNYTATKEPNHISAGFSITCTECHTTNPGWKPTNFNHTFFQLTLGHATPKCSDCHTSGTYASASSECYSCHQQDYLSAKEPDHNASGFSHTCTDCHTTNPGWQPTTFNHNLFPLTLGHSTPKCSDCHIGGNYKTTPIDCYSCHKTDYSSTTEPNHTAAGFSITCTDCHTTNPGWKPTTFNHTAFPLTLGHSTPKCSDCHTSGSYSTTPIDCYSCHSQDYLSTSNPSHTASMFSHTCTDCHTTNPGWQPVNFNHSIFPLTLGHSTPACIDCHAGGNYTNISRECYSCHQPTFLATKEPNHTTAGFSTTCTDCHTTNPGWTPTTFNHNLFPLTLGHSIPKCIDCHVGGNFTSTSTDCYTCHQQDYLSATDPNHSTGGFPHTCKDCHTTNPGWKPASFSHTTFPLTLGHSGPTCSDCHKGNYSSTSSDCYSCHQANYNSTINPNHRTLSFATTCTQCHTTNPGWKPASYRQHDTQFPIYSGRHNGQWSACTDCHTNPANYLLFSCVTCHEHNKTDMDSKHRGNGGYTYDSAACFRCHPRGNS